MFSKNIGIADSNQAELMAIVDALSYVVEAKFDPPPDIIVESNSKVVISWLNHALDQPWKYNNLLNSLQNLYLNLGNISFVHVYREANHFVDSLAKMSVYRTFDLVAWL
ncbi:hypothetical protein PTKIN_Ptkin09bG0282100 [Pterospermum kingtungense]